MRTGAWRVEARLGPGVMAIVAIIVFLDEALFRHQAKSKVGHQRVAGVLGIIDPKRMTLGTVNGIPKGAFR